MNIVFCSSEVFPFAKTGGLGDVCGSLPLALEKGGQEVSIFMPGYRSIGQSGLSIEALNGQVSRATVGLNTKVYFIDHDEYFDREGFYGDDSGDYKDNIERFSYFCDQILVLLKSLDIRPDIVHCHDWQTALVPVYLKEKYGNDPFYTKIKSLLTIHNFAFQGIFPKADYSKLGLNGKLLHPQGFEFHDQVNLLKAGIMYSDMVTTVSPQYAKEIRTKQFGFGLEHALKKRQERTIGILNGLDDGIWNPETDHFIFQNYAASNCNEAKAANRMRLQKEMNLEFSGDIPLFGFVGRLSEQKGIDLILEAMEDLVKNRIQVVCLGVGELKYQERLKKAALKYPESVAVCTDFNEALGHKIYAASDFFLMPSRFEPCGLSQMISLRYGTIPIIYKTGGLIDSVKPMGLFNQDGNGFAFNKYTKSEFINTVKKAVKIFEQTAKFHQMRKNALRADFSWGRSAQKYQELYQCM